MSGNGVLLVSIPALATLVGVIVTAVLSQSTATNVAASQARQALVDDQRERIDMKDKRISELEDQVAHLEEKVAAYEQRATRGSS